MQCISATTSGHYHTGVGELPAAIGCAVYDEHIAGERILNWFLCLAESVDEADATDVLQRRSEHSVDLPKCRRFHLAWML